MNTKPISLAAVRRMFPAGVEFRAEYLGPNPNPKTVGMRRVVKCNAHRIESVMLEGPAAGCHVSLHFDGCSAAVGDGFVDFSAPDSQGPMVRFWQQLQTPPCLA